MNSFGKGFNIIGVHLYVKVPHGRFKTYNKISITAKFAGLLAVLVMFISFFALFLFPFQKFNKLPFQG